MNFSDLFYYDETSPSCLRWKVNRYKGKAHAQLHVPAGSVAGCLNSVGYYQVNIDNKSYLAHRIIYEIINGKIEKSAVIDHINRDRSDNRRSNLRSTTRSGNQQNRSKCIKNTSGFTGVVFTTVKSKGKHFYYWAAQWRDEKGSSRQKQFSIKRYGLLEAFAMACAYRESKLKQLNDSGKQYSDSHGK